MRILLFLQLLLLASCSMYKQEFDCRTPLGVPCTSETDLEAMIIETKQGPDLFLSPENCSIKKCPAERFSSTLQRKVWVCDQTSEKGSYIQGHYIYQTSLPFIED